MQKRTSKFNVNSIILDRWSPRAMSGEEMTEAELMTLFEAARWAPSSYNGQPWRFIYAKRNTPAWQKFFSLMVPFNQSWAKDAAVLIVVISRTTFAFNNKPSKTHSFDTGAACENLALQAHDMGLVAHAMEGFDYERARKELNIPQEYAVETMFAVGKPGNIEQLPKELQQRETLSDRNPLGSMVFEGQFKTE